MDGDLFAPTPGMVPVKMPNGSTIPFAGANAYKTCQPVLANTNGNLNDSTASHHSSLKRKAPDQDVPKRYDKGGGFGPSSLAQGNNSFCFRCQLPKFQRYYGLFNIIGSSYPEPSFAVTLSCTHDSPSSSVEVSFPRNSFAASMSNTNAASSNNVSVSNLIVGMAHAFYQANPVLAPLYFGTGLNSPANVVIDSIANIFPQKPYPPNSASPLDVGISGSSTVGAQSHNHDVVPHVDPDPGSFTSTYLNFESSQDELSSQSSISSNHSSSGETEPNSESMSDGSSGDGSFPPNGEPPATIMDYEGGKDADYDLIFEGHKWHISRVVLARKSEWFFDIFAEADDPDESYFQYTPGLGDDLQRECAMIADGCIYVKAFVQWLYNEPYATIMEEVLACNKRIDLEGLEKLPEDQRDKCLIRSEVTLLDHASMYLMGMNYQVEDLGRAARAAFVSRLKLKEQVSIHSAYVELCKFHALVTDGANGSNATIVDELLLGPYVKEKLETWMSNPSISQETLDDLRNLNESCRGGFFDTPADNDLRESLVEDDKVFEELDGILLKKSSTRK